MHDNGRAAAWFGSGVGLVSIGVTAILQTVSPAAVPVGLVVGAIGCICLGVAACVRFGAAKPTALATDGVPAEPQHDEPRPHLVAETPYTAPVFVDTYPYQVIIQGTADRYHDRYVGIVAPFRNSHTPVRQVGSAFDVVAEIRVESVCISGYWLD